MTAVRRTSSEPAAPGVWRAIVDRASAEVAAGSAIGAWVEAATSRHADFGAALGARLAEVIAGVGPLIDDLMALYAGAVELAPDLAERAAEDLLATVARHPATADLLAPFLFFKGFHALQWHRAAHALWRSGRQLEASFVQSRVSATLAIDIHPAARIGRRIFVDHGTGIVIGETAVVGDDVSILHEVTLGDRHPKVRDGVLLAAGAKILGAIEIGRGANVAAGSVVVRDVPAWTTVAGVPARAVEKNYGEAPSLTMNQSIAGSNYLI